MPAFSIIIPVYNVAPYLRECLDSVLAQTFTDWEAICVDDGSTDGSGEILDGYAAKDTRFRVIHQANAGVSAARNKALDNAQGEWIGFLDADDVWAKAWLSEIVAGIEDDVDWIRTGWTDWNSSGEVPQSAKKHLLDNYAKEDVSCGNKLRGIGWHLISRCSFPFVNYFRLKAIGNERFPHGVRFREDALFSYSMATKAQGLKFVDARGYFRREHLGGATFSPRRRDDTINLLAGYVELWKNGSLDFTDESVRATVLEASTFWVRKDILQWFELCADRTPRDEFEVWRLTRKLLQMGAISREVSGTRFDRYRWKLYLATGWGRILLINRLNLLGRPTNEANT